jgi:hypothetical protein
VADWSTRPRDDGPGVVALNSWLVVALGAVIGLALGIAVSLTTDVPLAPEIGALAGGLFGYILVRIRTPRP